MRKGREKEAWNRSLERYRGDDELYFLITLSAQSYP